MPEPEKSVPAAKPDPSPVFRNEAGPDRVAVAKAINAGIAGKLREYGDLLVEQGADGFRQRAYWRAADVIGALAQPVEVLLAERGQRGLEALPAVGTAIAAAVVEMVRTGRWSQLDRLRGEMEPAALFQSLPGIGETLSHRLADDNGLESLEDLENALKLGEPAIEGIGPRRKRMLLAVLAERLGRVPSGRSQRAELPPVEMLLTVDRMYRERATRNALRKIAPRRFNPDRKAWLPIMHASHDDWHFTAFFSNTALAHKLDKTDDWVVIYHQREGQPEGRSTVVTETRGPTAGQRTVRGREGELPHDAAATTP